MTRVITVVSYSGGTQKGDKKHQVEEKEMLCSIPGKLCLGKNLGPVSTCRVGETDEWKYLEGTFNSSGPTVFSAASLFSVLFLKQPMMSMAMQMR